MLAPRSSPPPPSRQADLFNHDVCFAPQAAQQLSTAYTLLGRAPFAKLAKLHRESGNLKAAAHYHRLNLVRLEKEAPDSAETVEALLFLANYYKRAERWRDAEACCTRLLDFAGPEKQNAKALLREMHNIQDARAAGRAAGDAQPPPPGA